MRITSQTRRTAALMAASTIGLSTLVLGATGVASASPASEIDFSTDPSDAQYVDQLVMPGGNLVIPAGYCAVDWQVQGASGGDSDAAGGAGTVLDGTTTLDRTATTFKLFAGLSGKSAEDGGQGGENGRSGDSGTDGTDDGAGMLGGGGGAASTVELGGAAYLRAPGGDGGDGANAAGHGTGGGPVQLHAGVTATDTSYGDGAIYGTAYPCTAAPQVNWVMGGDEHSLIFQIDAAGYVYGDDEITDLQYSFDGTSWTTIPDADLDVTPDGYEWEGSIGGLLTGQEYSVQFRWVTTGELSNPSAAQTASTLLPAPTAVSAVVGPSSITVSWQPPAGNSVITGYSVHASAAANAGAQAGNEPPHCSPADAATLTCTVIVPAGDAYDVVVAADGGMDSAVLRTGVVPAPSAPNTVPTANGPLSTPTGAPSGLAQGSSVTLTGSGYAPNSTVSVYIYSTPTLLGTVVTDGTGSFSKAFTIPATLAPGSHHLVSAGVDASGNPRYLTSAVTVAQATGSLAWTGFETLPVLGAGVVLVGAGAGLVVTARRRRTA